MEHTQADEAIWYLGKSIELLAQADFYIGVEYSYFFKGCDIENDVARMYEIKRTMVKIEELMPDAEAIMNKEEM